MHLYFKRAKGSEVTFGDATWNRELVAQVVLDAPEGRGRPGVDASNAHGGASTRRAERPLRPWRAACLLRSHQRPRVLVEAEPVLAVARRSARRRRSRARGGAAARAA